MGFEPGPSGCKACVFLGPRGIHGTHGEPGQEGGCPRKKAFGMAWKESFC